MLKHKIVLVGGEREKKVHRRTLLSSSILDQCSGIPKPSLKFSVWSVHLHIFIGSTPILLHLGSLTREDA